MYVASFLGQPGVSHHAAAAVKKATSSPSSLRGSSYVFWMNLCTEQWAAKQYTKELQQLQHRHCSSSRCRHTQLGPAENHRTDRHTQLSLTLIQGSLGIADECLAPFALPNPAALADDRGCALEHTDSGYHRLSSYVSVGSGQERQGTPVV